MKIMKRNLTSTSPDALRFVTHLGGERDKMWAAGKISKVKLRSSLNILVGHRMQVRALIFFHELLPRLACLKKKKCTFFGGKKRAIARIRDDVVSRLDEASGRAGLPATVSINVHVFFLSICCFNRFSQFCFDLLSHPRSIPPREYCTQISIFNFASEGGIGRWLVLISFWNRLVVVWSP